MSDRLDTERILDWLDGRLRDDEADEVAVLLAAADDETRRTLEWLRSFRTAARQFELDEPPPLVGQRLRRAFAAREGLAGPVVIRRALLTADTRDSVHLAGVRAAPMAGAGGFQLVYTAGAAEIILNVEAVGEQRRISGQVLADIDTLPVFEAICHTGTGTVMSLNGDELGGFELPTVPSTAHLLVLTNDELRIEVPLDLVDDGR